MLTASSNARPLRRYPACSEGAQNGASNLSCSWPNALQRLVGAAKKLPLPEGTYAVGAGLIILGLTAYGFQILAAKRLSGADYTALNGLWALVFVVTPGLFQPLEQEVGRALVAPPGARHRRRPARQARGPPRRDARVVVVVGSPRSRTSRIVDNLFHGNGTLMVGLIIAIVCYYVAFITRGTLSGNGRFGPYGLMLGSEGTSGSSSAHARDRRVDLGRLVRRRARAAAVVAVLVALRGQHGLVTPGPDAPYSELSGALGLLLVGSVFAQLLSYISVLGVQLLATPAERETIRAGFITGIFIARIPLLMFQAMQAALLPKLARLAGEGKHDDFRSGMLRLVVVVTSLCVFGTIVAALIGPGRQEALPDKWTSATATCSC